MSRAAVEALLLQANRYAQTEPIIEAIEDLDGDDGGLAHLLWTYGLAPRHSDCISDDGDYENTCKVCQAALDDLADKITKEWP